MERIRTIKPIFFLDEELSPALTAFYRSLADGKGRLEDRPKRIKAEVLPYDEDGALP